MVWRRLTRIYTFVDEALCGGGMVMLRWTWAAVLKKVDLFLNLITRPCAGVSGTLKFTG